MANELVIHHPTGATLYALLFDATGQIYNGSTFGAPSSASWTDYDIAMTEAATATGIYRASMPAVAAGAYGWVVRKQAGANPAVGDITVGAGSIRWTGTAEEAVPATANVTAVKDTLLTESVAGRLAAALSTLLDVATPVLTAASVNQTGDAFARLGAPAGANVSADVAAVKADTAAVKAKTDNLPSDPADQSELLAAIEAIEAGSAPTVEAIRAEIDANSTRLAAIQLVTDAIDVSEVTLAPVNIAGHLTITTALTFETSITGLAVPSDWTSAVWTLKRSRRELDTASIIKLVESNPGVGTDGVTVLNGAAPVSPLTAAAGALTIDAGAGTAGIRLTDDLTAELAVRPGLIWGLKFLRSNGDSKEYAGTADIDLSVVHGV